MEYLVTADEMKQYDANTMNILGIPGMVLMERAALAAFSLIEKRLSTGSRDSQRILIMAGTGNNGGDGLALARLLAEADYSVDVMYVGNEDRASEQWKQQKHILKHYSVGTCSKINEAEYTIMVDALFGVGLSRNIEGEYAQAVADFNGARAFKLALDIPSGIHSDTGRVLGCAICADVTVTFGFCKRGLMFFPGKSYAGELVIAPIGITPRSFLGQKPELFFYDESVRELLPKRDEGGNKGTFGKVALIAGNPKMAGAAVLSAKAAYRSGAGMVKVITAAENRVILQQTVPEVLYGTEEDLMEALQWADVIAIGPGLGTGAAAKALLEQVIFESRLPMVIDADALNLLAVDEKLRAELARQGLEGRRMVLTPHVGELARLLQLSVGELKQDLLQAGRRLAEALHVTVVAKDARTFICREGETSCVNICGNSGMATAGSGDVLTGVIAGLLAQGMEVFRASSVGVYLHALAGDAVADKLGEYACMAGDICNKIGDVHGVRNDE